MLVILKDDLVDFVKVGDDIIVIPQGMFLL
jgi:hypothetical protein